MVTQEFLREKMNYAWKRGAWTGYFIGIALGIAAGAALFG